MAIVIVSAVVVVVVVGARTPLDRARDGHVVVGILGHPLLVPLYTVGVATGQEATGFHMDDVVVVS